MIWAVRVRALVLLSLRGPSLTLRHRVRAFFSERDDILFGSYLRVESWFLRLRSESRLGSAGGNPNSPVPKLYWVSRIPFCPSVESTSLPNMVFLSQSFSTSFSEASVTYMLVQALCLLCQVERGIER